MLSRAGRIYCLCGPAGAGKNRLAQEVILASGGQIERFVTSTTRAPRPGEADGRDYHFLSREQFECGISAGDYFEYEEVHGNLYGPSRKELLELLSSGCDVMLVIDIKGCLKVKLAFPERCSIIFVTVPSMEVLKERITSRSKVSEEELARRLQTARAEMDQLEQDQKGPRLVDHIVLNDDLPAAIAAITRLISDMK